MIRNTLPDFHRTRDEIEQIVTMARLHLYNKGLPCGAKAIRNLLFEQCVLPLPSVSTIKRILSRNCLTYGRTGYYPGDGNGEYK
jgi:putative transposase